MSYTLAHRDDCLTEGKWCLVRRTLDIDSFGMNLVEIRAGEQIPEHDESDRDQEEVFLTLGGQPHVRDRRGGPSRAGRHVRAPGPRTRTHGAQRRQRHGERADRLGAPLERLRADGMGMSAATDELREVIDAYNEAWNAHDVERIGSMHADDMVFENHTAGERAEGEEALAHIAGIFAAWPDIEFRTRRLYVREDLVVQEWTASATHTQPLRRGELVAEPSGRRVEWEGMDIIPFERGKVKRKDVYSDSISILRQVGLV